MINEYLDELYEVIHDPSGNGLSSNLITMTDIHAEFGKLDLDFEEFPFDINRISANFRKVLRVGLIKLNKTYYLVAIVPVLSTELFPIIKLTSIPKLAESKEYATFVHVDHDEFITDKNYEGILVEKLDKLKMDCTVLEKQYLCERNLRFDKQKSSCELSIINKEVDKIEKLCEKSTINFRRNLVIEGGEK